MGERFSGRIIVWGGENCQKCIDFVRDASAVGFYCVSRRIEKDLHEFEEGFRNAVMAEYSLQGHYPVIQLGECVFSEKAARAELGMPWHG